MISACWTILCQLAPWLLLGMLLSGILHVFLPEGFVRRKFQGASGVLKAVLLGVPLPLCSCGVVPAGIGLKNQGASDGAAVGFLISTPQTGVDSILVSASFFGWPFAFFKMFSAAVMGVLGGLLAEVGPSAATVSDDPDSCSNPDHAHGEPTHSYSGSKLWKVWAHGIEIVQSIWIWLLIGIVISAVIEQYIPPAWFETIGSWGLLPAMCLVLLISTPLYVCATASVPIAAALVVGGLPPAAALVFLMAGPATNVTTIGAIYSRFGLRTLGVYLATIIVGSMIFAWLFDWLLTAKVSEHLTHAHDHNNWWSTASAILLSCMVAWFLWCDLKRWIRRRHSSSNSAIHEKMQRFNISGMTCNNCVGKLETALNKPSEVVSAIVNLETGTATIVGDIHADEVGRIVEGAGFHAEPESMGATQNQ